MFLSNEKKSYPKCFKNSSKPNKFCPGCGHSIVLKELGFAIDEMKIQKDILFGIDIGCSLLAWDFFDVDTVQTHHGRTVPVVSGYKLIKQDKVCIAYVGDGGAYAIGLQSLLTSANRNDAILVIVVNNTLYAMTGGQMAPTTLSQEITTTTPKGKNILEKGNPVMGPELIKCLKNKNAYIARSIISKPYELRKVLKKAITNQIKNKSFSFVEVLSTCPTNWKTDAQKSFDMLDDKMATYFSNLGEI